VTTTALPPELAAARDRLLVGVSRRDLAEQAAALSQRYRSVAESHARTTELLAYAVTRMPATYAAVASVLDEITARAPEFSPRCLLDLGSGPGTVAWAATTVFREIEAVTTIDREPGFHELAAKLAQTDPLLARTTRLHADLERSLVISEQFDLVTAAFTLAEITLGRLPDVIETAWAMTSGMLVLVEPGTPAGFARILTARAQLVAAGGRIVAPCPQEGPCPLSGDDWCHFAARLPREKDHRAVKGGMAPFEDEKYTYIVVARGPVSAIEARVLKPPRVSKVETVAHLCGTHGLSEVRIPSRDRDAYRKSQKWRWGTAISG